MLNNLLTMGKDGFMVSSMPSSDSQIASAPYPKALLKQIDDYAKYKGVSRSDVLRWAAADFVQKIRLGGRDATG